MPPEGNPEGLMICFPIRNGGGLARDYPAYLETLKLRLIRIVINGYQYDVTGTIDKIKIFIVKLRDTT